MNIQVVVVLARQLSNSSPEALLRALQAYHQLNLTALTVPRVYQTVPNRVKWLSDSELLRLVQQYRAGATIYELATEFGIHRHTVSQHLKQQDVRMRRCSPTEPDIDDMVRLYQSGLSLAKVGDRLGFDATTVLTHIRRCGVQTRDCHGR